MNILEVCISDKIKEDSLEFKSMKDKNKISNIYNVAKYGFNSTNENRGGQLENLKNEFENFSNRIFHIPINTPKIYHLNNAKVCSYGGVFENNKITNESLNNYENNSYQQNTFDYIENLSIFKIRNTKELKDYIKKIYFKFFSIRAYKNKKIFMDPSKPKIIFFCAWFSNAYHFTFEAYTRLLILLEYAKENRLDFYIIAPPKYRGFIKYHNWFIDEILAIEKIQKDKILYLDYQNYNVKNIYFCSNPQGNTKETLKAINKLKQNLFIKDFNAMGERLFISRKKSPRRYLINEDEIFHILESKFGFKRIYMEDYTLKEKINHIMRAKIVMSIEGTSVVNGLFMDYEDSKLISLRSYDMTDHLPIFASIFKNIEYLPIICDIEDKKGDKHLWVESNLSLNPQYLIQKLKEYKIDEI